MAPRRRGRRRGRSSSRRSTSRPVGCPWKQSSSRSGPEDAVGGGDRRVERARHDPRHRRRSIEAAHAAGAKAFVDAVHLAPHRPIDIGALGCDALATSPYKWYGPHAGRAVALAGAARIAPAVQGPPRAGHRARTLRDRDTGVRSDRRHPRRRRVPAQRRAWRSWPQCRTGGVRAAARRAARAPARHGPRAARPDGRTPTVCFTVAGHTTDDVAAALAAEQIAVWGGQLLRGRGDGGARARPRAAARSAPGCPATRAPTTSTGCCESSRRCNDHVPHPREVRGTVAP